MKKLLRGDKKWFKWSKQGIILLHPRGWINLDNLYNIDKNVLWDLLDNMLEHELEEYENDDVKEVIKYFIEK